MASDINCAKKWEELEKQAPASVVASLKKLADAFDGTKLIKWMAGLWDPEVGGFYYSNSARDTEGYYPDIESTHQLIGILCSNGALSQEDLPEEFKAKMLNFVKSCQSPDDGYFYHPQWPKGRENLQNDRYGRDLNRSIGFISTTTLDECGDGVQKKQYPNYCILSCKCKKHAGTDERCVFPPEKPITEVRNNTGSKPDFSSPEAFSAWLEEYNFNIKEHSGQAHKLSALGNIIASHGYTDIVLDHLERVQEELYQEQIAAGIEPTGLWQTVIDYHAVWGLLKYASFFNHPVHGREFKHAENIIRTCIKVISLAPNGDYRMNDLFNQWLGIQRLFDNMSRFNPDKIPALREILYQDIAPLIDNSLAKILPMALEDGTFTYTTERRSLKKIYGVPISLGLEEGDVNAEALVTMMYNGIYTTLGFDAVPLQTPEDGKLFLKLISEAKPIVKRPASEKA